MEQNCITILDRFKEKTINEKFIFCKNFFANDGVNLTKLAIDAELKLFVSHKMIKNVYKLFNKKNKYRQILAFFFNYVSKLIQ